MTQTLFRFITIFITTLTALILSCQIIFLHKAINIRLIFLLYVPSKQTTKSNIILCTHHCRFTKPRLVLSKQAKDKKTSKVKSIDLNPHSPSNLPFFHHPKVESTRKGNNKKSLQKLNHDRYTCSRVPATNQRQHGVGGVAKFSQSASTLLTTHQPRPLLWVAVGEEQPRVGWYLIRIRYRSSSPESRN